MRMQAVGEANNPGKDILDSYPFLQSLPEFITPYKKTWRASRAESHGFWMGLTDTVKERMNDGTAAPSFTRDLIERRKELGISDSEFALLTGGIFGAGELRRMMKREVRLTSRGGVRRRRDDCRKSDRIRVGNGHSS